MSLTPLFEPAPKDGFYISPEPTAAEMAMMGSGSGSGSGSGCPGCSITGAHEKILPGELVTLTVSCDAGKIPNVNWTIPGLIFKDYKDGTTTPDQNTAKVIAMAPADFKNITISFRWRDDGNGRKIKVTFTRTIGGVSTNCLEEITLNVGHPFRPVGGQYQMGEAMFNADQSRLGLFKPPNAALPGLWISGKVTVPPPYFQGYWHYVQLIKTTILRKDNDGTCTKATTVSAGADDFWLDKGYPTGPPPRAPEAGYPGKWVTNLVLSHVSHDSPQSDLLGKKAIKREDSFQLYMMFRSTMANSRWVPITMIEWAWSACATKDANGVWTLHKKARTEPKYNDDPAHPKWTKNITSLTFNNVTCPGDPFCG